MKHSKLKHLTKTPHHSRENSTWERGSEKTKEFLSSIRKYTGNEIQIRSKELNSHKQLNKGDLCLKNQ